MDYEKLKSGVIPLLASPQAGVAASSIKCRAAIAAGVVFLLFSIGKPPRPRVSGGFATLLLIARPPLLAVMQGGEYTAPKRGLPGSNFVDLMCR